ncbi:MAG: Crp/Fnr family transcriptional regulator [Anaerolineae bacterium]|nr:Crp/Fnr family transcriptional regulator [Anaerolineae bacterium]
MVNNKTITQQQSNWLNYKVGVAAALSHPNHRKLNHTMHDLDDRLHILRQMPLFAGLGELELSQLAADFRPRAYHQGETIFHEGDPGQALYVVAHGRIRIYIQNEEGQETSVILYGPATLFGELSVIDERPRSASAIAMEDSILYNLDQAQFRHHLKQSPQLALNFMQTLADRVRYSTSQVESLTLMDVPSRLARKLMELARDHGRAQAEGVIINITLTQTDLAGLVGATRESVNKTIRAFRQQKLIKMEQGRITILDPEALRQRL